MNIEDIATLATKYNLVLTGSSNQLQWLGTNLHQQLALSYQIEVSPIYGKLVTDLDSFCYQLCHSTPWGFEMGRNSNAVLDVLRGNPTNHKKCLIWMDAQQLFLSEKRLFLDLLDILKINSAESTWNSNFILLFSDCSKTSLAKVLQKQELHNIEYLAL